MKKQLYGLAGLSLLWLGCVVQEPESAVEPGRNAQAIIGGTAATPGQFPYQARLTVYGDHACGGSLIHPKWVLTAGHCVEGVNPGSMQVVLGDHLIDQYEASEQVHTVRRFITHPGFRYEGSTPVDDVALIELNTEATLNAAVQTIELQGSTASQTAHTVSGWGWPYGGAYQPSNTLLHASLPVTSSADCGAVFGRGLFASELCAGYASGAQGACHTDSGGPLATQAAIPTLVGVVSWGRGYWCNSYTVFARVSSFVSWIDSQINCVPCPMSGTWFDSQNCYVGSPPSGTTPFEYNGAWYYTPLSTPTCPMSNSGYDGANCYAGTPPAGSRPFIYNGSLYYRPQAGNQCPLSGSWFDGGNCYVGTAPAGTTPFELNGSLYYTPVHALSCPMSGSWYDGANCYVGSPPTGTSPFEYNNAWYYTPVCRP